MAPEALLTSAFTLKSDVWAYGVTFWEILTLGASPFGPIDEDEVPAHVEYGYRLERPAATPQSVFDAVEACWAKDPAQRPVRGCA